MQLNRIEYYPQRGSLSVRLLKSDGKYHRYMYENGDTPTEEELDFTTAMRTAAVKAPDCACKKVIFDIKTGELIADKIVVTDKTIADMPLEVIEFATTISSFSSGDATVSELQELTSLVDEEDTVEEEEIEIEEDAIEVIEGVAILGKKKRKKMAAKTTDLLVVDIDNNPVYGPDVPLTDDDGEPILKELKPAIVDVEGKILVEAITEPVMTRGAQLIYKQPVIRKGKKVTEAKKERLKLLRARAKEAITLEVQPAITRKVIESPKASTPAPTTSIQPTKTDIIKRRILPVKAKPLSDLLVTIGAGTFVYGFDKMVVATDDPIFPELVSRDELTLYGVNPGIVDADNGGTTYSFDSNNRVTFVTTEEV